MKPALSPSLSTASGHVALVDLRRQYDTLRDEVLAAIARVCDSQGFILGPEVEALEREICSLTGAAGAAGCASGTEALWLALVAAGVRPGDSVVTTAFSFFASASAIVRAGATPVFVDVDPGTLNLDPCLVEKRLRGVGEYSEGAIAPDTSFGSAVLQHTHSRASARGNGKRSSGARRSQAPVRRFSAKVEARGKGRIRAILPVHLYGQCADMDALDRISREFNAAIVEDAAQAIGAAWRGRGAGSLGVTAAFSFYPTKNLSAYGDAGIATSTHPELAERMRRLRNHGSPRRYYHEEFGWNGRMDAIQAAVLRVKLPHVAKWNEARRQHAASYDRLFAEAGLTSTDNQNRDSDVSSKETSAQSPERGATSRGTGSQQAKPLSGSAPIRPLARDPCATHVFHQYVIRAHRRDELRRFLTEHKIGTEIYYPLPLHLQPALSYLGLKEGDLPVAEQAAKEVLALPMFPELTESEIRRVVQVISEFYS